MKILLLNLPFKEDYFYKEDFFKKGKQSPLFPIGLSYVAKALMKQGHEVKILDIYAEQLSYNAVIEKLKTLEFEIVGISALVTQYKYCKWLCGEIKKINPACRLILGNGLATACDKIILDTIKEIEICVRHEGELTMVELLENNLENLEGISGISYRQNGQFVRNPDRQIIRDIDALGLPAYELFKMELYLKSKFYDTGVIDLREMSKGENLRTASVITARGCPYNCNFCGKVIPFCRLRSIEEIVKEIKFLIDTYQINAVHFIDELFVITKERTLKLCEELKKLNLKWDCQGRVNLVNDEILKIMKDSGCLAIGFGVESGDARILQNMNKQTTPEQIKQAILGAQRAGLLIKNQLLFGYPGENRESLNNTVKLMKAINDPGRRFSYIQPIPGTALYRQCLEKKLITDEVYYLYMLKHGFDEGQVNINFTEFRKTDIPLMMKYYFHKMEINYLLNALTSIKRFIYLIKRPKTILRLLKITVRHYVRIINGDYPFVFSQKNLFYRIVKRI